MKGTAHRFTRILALTFALSGVIAGGALAAHHPDGGGGSEGVGSGYAVTATPTPDWFERAALRASTEATSPVIPNDRGGLQGVGSAVSVVAAPTPDWFERAVIRESSSTIRPDDRSGLRGPGAFAATDTAPGSVVSGEDGGFSWSDGLVGAAGMLGLLLVGLVAGLALTRGRGRRPVLR